MSVPVDSSQLAAQYEAHGYVRIPGAVSGDELAALRAETMAQIEAGPREPAEDFGHSPLESGPAVQYRVDNLVRHALVNDSVLIASVHPVILDAVGALFRTPVNGAHALVFKGPRGGGNVPMHTHHLNIEEPVCWTIERDVCNVSIYLDRADSQSGCLRVLPGSHRRSVPELRAIIADQFDIPGLVEVAMEPGDVMLHSEFIVHGSRPTPPGGPLRRVVYFAFAEGDRETREYTARRALWLRRLQEAARRRALTSYPAGGRPFEVPAAWADDVDAVSDDALREALGASADPPGTLEPAT